MSEAIVASVAVEVVPSAESFGDKLRRKLIPDADRIGTEVGRMLSERIQSALGDVRVKVDTGAAKADIDLIREDLRRLGNDDARIRVSVETAAARAELDRLRADLAKLGNGTTTHTVRVRQVGDGNSGGAGGGGFSMMAAGMSLLPALIPIAAAAVPLIGGIGAGLVGAAVAGGVLKASFTGIGDAVSALGAKSAQTGQQLKQQAAQQLAAQNAILNAQDALASSLRGLANARTRAAEQAISSAEAVSNAERAETDARRSARQGVTTAQQSYTSALYAEHQAQVSLNEARVQARLTLQDLENQAKDGALSQRQAVIDLQKARDTLTVIDFNPHSTAQQRAEAQLQVDQAKQHLSELELANTRLADRKAVADKQGVANAPAVVAAEHSMAEATRTRRDAEAGVVEARRAGAESISKAEQGVSDALRSQVQQAAAAEQAIISAQQSVVSAQRSLAQAYASAAAQGVTANAAVESAMAALTPAGRRFARFVNDELKPAWKGVTDAAQTGFLPGFQKALQILLPYLPGFAKFVGDIGRELGGMATSAARALTSPFWRQFGAFLGDMAKSSLSVLGQVLGNLAMGFAGLFEAIAPAGDGVGGGMVSITKAFADWSTHLGTNKGFQQFMQYVKDNSPAVGRFFRDLLEIGGKLIVALAPLGVVMAVVIERIAAFLAKLSPQQLLAVGAGIAIAVAVLTGGFGAIVVATTAVIAGLVQLYLHNQKFRDFIDGLVAKIREGVQYIKDHWRGMVASLVQAYDEHLKPMVDQWAKILTSLWTTVVRPILGFIIEHWRYFALAVKLQVGLMLLQFKVLTESINFLWFDVFKPTIDFIVGHWHYLATAIRGTYNDVLKPVWSALTTAFTATGTAFGKFRDGLSAVWSDIRAIFTKGYNFITQNILNKFIGAINKVTHVFGIGPIDTIDPIVKGGGGAGGAIGGGAVGNSRKVAMARGGILPGFTPGVDVHRFVSPTGGVLDMSGGEGILVPEAVRGLGAGFVYAANKHFSNRPASSDGRHFIGGGVIGALDSFGDGVNHHVRSAAGSAAGLGADAVLSVAEGVARRLLSHLRPQIIKDIGTGAFGFIDKGLRAFIGRSGGSGGPITGDHKALIDQALKLSGVPVTAGNEADVNMIAKFESGWNPKAINLTDSNAVAGHPSQGLMQTIPGTFAAYGLPGLGGITDPLANLVAGIRYATSRYGSLDDVPGVRAVHSGGSYVGYDSGGYLKPGVTQVYNGTGRPEPVFTSGQWDQLSAALDRGAAEKPTEPPLTFNIHDAGDPYATAHAIAQIQQFLAST